MLNIERAVLRFHRRLSADPCHRYRSWGHCYRYFRRRAQIRADHRSDQGALHLAFYLASWGMYRGSGFLLWKDFRIHRWAVREVLDPRYDVLQAFQPTSHRRTSAAIRQIIRLADRIRDGYCRQIASVNGRRAKVDVSDTLVTKILLATLACVPAYDTYVITGLRAGGVAYSTLSEKNLTALFEWYRRYQSTFDSLRATIDEDGLRYPPMKLLDMYFWEAGRHLARLPDR